MKILYHYQNLDSSCAFTCIAMLLSEYGIKISEPQLIKNSFVPYMIKYSKDQGQILAAFQIQDKPITGK